MKKRKSHSGCLLFAVLLFAAFFCAYKFPSYVKEERGKLAVRWNSGCAAWKDKNYSAAENFWNPVSLKLLLLRRPAKFLYWRAEALEELGRKKEAASVRSRLLSKYPMDYYAFLLVPHAGGVNAGNKKSLLEEAENNFRMPFEEDVLAAEKKSGIDRALIWAVMKRESKFNKQAVSASGAVGLMQLMPSTAFETAQKNGMGNVDLYSPYQNILLGALQLKALLKRYDGSVISALAAYNAGPAKVSAWHKNFGKGKFWLEEIPYAETREFVRCVFENYSVYRMLLTER